MEILKLLRVNGATEPNAALLDDSGEKYPIFLKSLHNTVMFDEFLASGYSLAGLPYDFVKNGKSIMELPVEAYTPTNEEMQMMYDSLGKEHEMSYLLSKVDTSIVRGLPIPSTNYKITTREGFLKYLTSLTYADGDDEFLPINYFVSPEARFDLSEYFADENARYIRIMERHRKMSYTKFQNLFQWLTQFGLSPNATFLDVLEAYFAWGIDGMNVPIVSKKRSQRAIVQQMNAAPVVRKVVGLIDGNGNIYPPMNERSTVWQPDVISEEQLQRTYRRLAENEVTTIQLKTPAPYDVITYSGVSLQIELSEYTLAVNRYAQSTIVVNSLASNIKTLPNHLTLPVNKDKMLEYCLAEAIASDNYKARKDNTKVSSFQVLTWSGASPSDAIRYLLRSLDMLATTSDKRFGPDGLVRLMPTDIENYLSGYRKKLTVDENGNESPNQEDTVLYDIVHGNINTDMVERGMSQDIMIDVSTLRNTVIALHDTLGVSYEDIYSKACNVQPNVKEVVISNGTLNYRMDMSPINNAVKGYEADMRDYDDKRANDCTFFYHITLVALECAGCGDDGKALSDRAVGIEALTVNLVRDKQAATVINTLVGKLLDAAEYTQLTVSVRDRLEESARRWAINSWFEIYARGTYTLPSLLGGMTTAVDQNMRDIVLKSTKPLIDSTLAFCKLAVRVYQDEVKFASYCTNAYVSLDRVIPRNKDSKIPAVPFYAAWCNYQRSNPAVHAALVDKGVIKRDFVPWECRYREQQLWKEGDLPLDSDTSLYTYYKDAVEYIKEYPNDLEFKCAPHYMDIAFPGLYKDINTPEDQVNGNDNDEDEDEDAPKVLAVPRKCLPVIKIGLKQDLTLAELSKYIKPSDVVIPPDIYLQKFAGFNAETMLRCSDIIGKIRSLSGKTPIVIISGTDKVVLSDTKEVIDFTRITTIDQNKYPVVHVYDRVWLLRTMDGELWEARL